MGTFVLATVIGGTIYAVWKAVFLSYHYEWVILTAFLAVVNCLVIAYCSPRWTKTALMITFPVVFCFTFDQFFLVHKLFQNDWDIQRTKGEWERSVYELDFLPSFLVVDGKKFGPQDYILQHFSKEELDSVFTPLPDDEAGTSLHREVWFRAKRSTKHGAFLDTINIGDGASYEEVCHLFKHPIFNLLTENAPSDMRYWRDKTKIDLSDIIWDYEQQFLGLRDSSWKAHTDGYFIGRENHVRPVFGMTFGESSDLWKQGLTISSVQSGEPADLAGIEPGMRVHAIKVGPGAIISGYRGSSQDWKQSNPASPAWQDAQSILNWAEPGMLLSMRASEYDEQPKKWPYKRDKLFSFIVGGDISDELHWSTMFYDAFETKGCLPEHLYDYFKGTSLFTRRHPQNFWEIGGYENTENQISTAKTCLNCIFVTKAYHSNLISLFSEIYLNYHKERDDLERDFRTCGQSIGSEKTNRMLRAEIRDFMTADYMMSSERAGYEPKCEENKHVISENLAPKYQGYVILHLIFFIFNMIIYFRGFSRLA